MEHRATQVLTELGVKIRSLVTPVGQLSGGQRQGIAICRSVLTDPEVVLLDEPTAALGVAQKEQVLNLLDRLRSQGRAVMVISHDLHDVQVIADKVVVLRLGRKVAEFVKGSFDSSDIVDAITGASSTRNGAKP
jgi:D-xylose transport system ATP-binding protein